MLHKYFHFSPRGIPQATIFILVKQSRDCLRFSSGDFITFPLPYVSELAPCGNPRGQIASPPPRSLPVTLCIPIILSHIHLLVFAHTFLCNSTWTQINLSTANNNVYYLWSINCRLPGSPHASGLPGTTHGAELCRYLVGPQCTLTE